MNFLKALFYLCLLALEILSANAAFSKGSPVKTLEDIVEGCRSQNPSCSEYPLLSHTNDTPPPMDKTPQAEHHFSSLAKNQDITPITKDNKRNLNDAFENAEDRPMKLAGIERKHYSLPQFSFNRGDFSNERDTFPTQTMNSHSSDVERDYATALKGSNRRYNDRVFGNNYISEHNHGLVVQPESLDAPYRIISNGAIETRVQEHHNLGEWILPMNIDLNRLFTSETTAGITGDSNNFLANNFKLSQQEEAKELDGEGKIPNRIFENHHSLHFKNDLKSLQKTRTKETNNNSMDRVDLPLSVKHQSQSLYLGNKDELDKIGLAKTSRSSSKASKKQNNAIRKKIKNDLMKDKGNKIRWISGQEKTFEDVVNGFKIKLEDLSTSSSKKSPLCLFLETIDNYADNESSEYVSKKKILSNLEYSNTCSQNPFIESFLGHNEIPISRSQFNELEKAYKESDGEGDKSLNQFFFKNIDDQINKNLEKNFYITHQQAKIFFTLINYDYKVESEILNKISKNRNYYSDQLANYLGEAINFFPWKVVSTSENRLALFDQREFYLKNKNVNRFGLSFGVLLNQRFDLRKLFLIYSTLLNKVLCSGEKDLLENFFSRQNSAINFFDEALSLLEVDRYKTDTYFIKSENLPLNEDVKKFFLEIPQLKCPKNTFQIKIINRNKGKIDVLWKILALWLAKDKFEHFRNIYNPKTTITVLLNFKNFFNSLLFFILRS